MIGESLVALPGEKQGLTDHRHVTVTGAGRGEGLRGEEPAGDGPEGGLAHLGPGSGHHVRVGDGPVRVQEPVDDPRRVDGRRRGAAEETEHLRTYCWVSAYGGMPLYWLTAPSPAL